MGNKDIVTSDEIREIYGDDLIKAFGSLVLCKHDSSYIVLNHPKGFRKEIDDYEVANKTFELLKSGAIINNK